MIYLLTGPVRSGKTTALVNWANGRHDVFGVLTPDVNGKRVFLDIATAIQFAMEAEPGEEAIMVGKFSFGKKNFDSAINIIRSAAGENGWLVIDEAGPLELRGEGFAAVLKEVVETRKNKIIIVVREGLTEKICNYFQLGNDEIKLIDNNSLSLL